MSQHDLPEAVCDDCIAFSAETAGAAGEPARGRCRFRPELGEIPDDLPACLQLKLRSSRQGLVRAPVQRKVAGAPRSRSRTAAPDPRPQRANLNSPLRGDTEGEITMDRDGLKQVLRELLEAETLYGYPAMGGRWQGGTLVLKPSDPELQHKEVPLESFFHKIVMLRDRLRVLESKLNGHKNLSEQEKVELQGYISKCYGTLTTFNVLFADKGDQFSSK